MQGVGRVKYRCSKTGSATARDELAPKIRKQTPQIFESNKTKSPKKGVSGFVRKGSLVGPSQGWPAGRKSLYNIYGKDSRVPCIGQAEHTLEAWVFKEKIG